LFSYNDIDVIVSMCNDIDVTWTLLWSRCL